MPYIPPSLREEVKQVVLDPTSEKDFPTLGISVSAKKMEGGMFAEKAREWENQRRELEYKIKVEEEYQEKIRLRKEREAEEYAIMFPEKKERPVANKREEIAQEEVKSEWTTVRKPPRREPKPKVDFDTRPEDELDSDYE
jgi:hypothetical protein